MTQTTFSPYAIDLAVKWIAALRSGEYKQTKGALRKADGFCCLGVLCDLTRKEGLVSTDWKERLVTTNRLYFADGEGNEVYEFDGMRIWPPDEVRSLIETDKLPISFWQLAERNDNGASFESIAADIEQALKNIGAIQS